MLGAVRDVAKGLLKEIGREKYFNLQNIANAVEAYTSVDKVVFISYDVPSTNPVLGQFKKYTRGPSAYASVETVVEIRYAQHLDLPWRRFVVCKELCHSLESDHGTHSATARSLDRLLSRFALLSANKDIEKSFPAFEAENLAELGALELLCPLEIRKDIANSDNHSRLCTDYGIPDAYATVAFEEEYICVMTSIFEDLC